MEIKILNYNSNKNVFYRVKAGDTLDSIANDYRVTKSYILQHNKNCLYEGQIIFLPETNLTSYVVKPFDTLKSIAKTNGITVESIKEKNSLKDEFLFVGQKLFL